MVRRREGHTFDPVAVQTAGSTMANTFSQATVGTLGSSMAITSTVNGADAVDCFVMPCGGASLNGTEG